jgi:hypothetical protein
VDNTESQVNEKQQERRKHPDCKWSGNGACVSTETQKEKPKKRRSCRKNLRQILCWEEDPGCHYGSEAKGEGRQCRRRLCLYSQGEQLQKMTMTWDLCDYCKSTGPHTQWTPSGKEKRREWRLRPRWGSTVNTCPFLAHEGVFCRSSLTISARNPLPFSNSISCFNVEDRANFLFNTNIHWNVTPWGQEVGLSVLFLQCPERAVYLIDTTSLLAAAE